jgi:universal stress protein A
MSYKHVLAAIDVTDEARQVLDQAREVASEHEAKLSIATVVKPLTHVYGGLDMVSFTQASVDFEEEARSLALSKAREMAADAGLEAADVHVLVGSPSGQIVAAAEAHGADLIVVGSHGKHGLGLLLGSTANGVLHHAETDVLTVRIA